MRTIHTLLFLLATLVLFDGRACSELVAKTTPRIAVLHEAGMPSKGHASSAHVLVEIFAGIGLEAELLSAEQLSDASILNTGRYRILVLPTGETFPVTARDNLQAFLRAGGHLITTGGYAFNDLVRYIDGRWASESDVIQEKWDRATSIEHSLLDDGQFEGTERVPVGGQSVDARWRRTDECASISKELPWRGEQCGMAKLSPSDTSPSSGFFAHVPVTAGHTYQVFGYLRARDLSGPGIAYLSVYQLDKDGQLVEFQDFAAVRQATDWKRFEYQFTPRAKVTKLRVQCGLYRKHGIAWFDDIQLFDVTGALPRPINTASGEPGDGLKVSPSQIGIFDASYPIKRACELRTAARRELSRQLFDLRGNSPDRPHLAYGSAAIDETTVFEGRGQTALLSLDRLDLRRSQAILLAPFETGQIVLPARDGQFVAVVGEFDKGEWTVLESWTLPRKTWKIDVDEDRATALILVCPKKDEAVWSCHLTRMLQRPDQIEGY